MLSSDRQKLGYPELKIFRTSKFDKPKYQRTQVSVYIDEPKYPKLKWALDEEWGRVGPWLTYLIWTPSTQPSLSSLYHLRLIRRILSILAVVGFDMRPSYCPKMLWGVWDGMMGAFSQCPISPLIQPQPRFCRAKPSHCGHVPLATGGTLRCACVYPSIHLKSPPTVLSGRPRIEESKENRMGEGHTQTQQKLP